MSAPAPRAVLVLDPAAALAVLAGAKRMARAPLTPQPPSEAEAIENGWQTYHLCPEVCRTIHCYSLNNYERLPKEPGLFGVAGSVGFVRNRCGQSEWMCPYGVPGDRLLLADPGGLLRDVDMQITDVGVERLHEITAADAALEGEAYAWSRMLDGGEAFRRAWESAAAERKWGDAPGDFRGAFAARWQRMHPVETWSRNEYVWKVSFRPQIPFP